MQSVPGYADSLDDPGNVQDLPAPLDRRDADGDRAGEGRAREPGPRDRPITANAALDVREQPVLRHGLRPLPHGRRPAATTGRPAPASARSSALNTAVMAVGEGNYGRLGPDQQQRFTAANRRLQLPDPGRAAGRDAGDRSVARLRPLDRPAVLRPRDGAPGLGHVRHAVARGAPAARRAAGHGPRAGSRSRRRCRPGQSRVAGSNIRLAGGAVDVTATHSGTHLHDRVALGVPLSRFTIGHTLPRGARWRGRRSTAARWPTPPSRATAASRCS